MLVTLGTDQNWIGSSSIRSALFVPPPVSEMQAALDTLENYLQASHDYPPLLRIALVIMNSEDHASFW